MPPLCSLLQLDDVRFLCLSLSRAGIVSERLERLSCFLHGDFRPLMLHGIVRKFGYLQNKGTRPCRNFGLKKFRHGTSIIAKTCCQLSSTEVSQSETNSCHRSTKLTVIATTDVRPTSLNMQSVPYV